LPKTRNWSPWASASTAAAWQDRQIAACAGCHSPTGAGIPSQYPRLGGQHAQYTAAQLTAFRDGGRKNSLPMSQVAAKLNDREIRALADYIAGLR
jgi:cytochrome c553